MVQETALPSPVLNGSTNGLQKESQITEGFALAFASDASDTLQLFPSGTVLQHYCSGTIMEFISLLSYTHQGEQVNLHTTLPLTSAFCCLT